MQTITVSNGYYYWVEIIAFLCSWEIKWRHSSFCVRVSDTALIKVLGLEEPNAIKLSFSASFWLLAHHSLSQRRWDGYIASGMQWSQNSLLATVWNRCRRDTNFRNHLFRTFARCLKTFMHLILWKSKNVKHLNVFWDLGHICMGSFQIPVSREHKMQITHHE